MSWQRPVSRDLGTLPSTTGGPYPAPLPARDPAKPRRWNTGCGTDPGYWKHRERGQTPCGPCGAAHKKALDDWAKARAATTPED